MYLSKKILSLVGLLIFLTACLNAQTFRNKIAEAQSVYNYMDTVRAYATSTHII
jgi:hypothetical protein